jgi:hypothetical protein
MKSVYRAVRTGSLNKAVCDSSLKGLEAWFRMALQTAKCESLGAEDIYIFLYKTCGYIKSNTAGCEMGWIRK